MKARRVIQLLIALCLTLNIVCCSPQAPQQRGVLVASTPDPKATLPQHYEVTVVFAEALPEPTDYELNYEFIKRVIISEAGDQGYDGMRAVAQVINDRVNDDTHNWGEGFYGVLTKKNQFARPYTKDISSFEPTVSDAMAAVFERGERVFEDNVYFFYDPAYSSISGIKFMTSMKYVGTINSHEFRTEWS